MPSERVRFKWNIPQQMALSDEPLELDGTEVIYHLADGRILKVNHKFSERLNTLDPKPGEAFVIVRNGPPEEWGLWLAGETEKKKAAQEIAELDLTRQLGASIKLAKMGKLRKRQPNPQQPPLFEQRGTGTDGPLPRIRTAPAPPLRVSYPDALRHIVGTVVTVLKEHERQWTAGAEQDLVSTLLIQAAKEGKIVFEFGGES